MTNLKSQAKTAFLWDFSGRLLMQGSGFIVTIFLARLLEPSDFGLIAIATVIIGIAQVFMDIGLSSALIQRHRVLPIHYSSVFYFNIIIGLSLSAIIFISSFWIGDFYNNQLLIPVIQVMSVLFILNALSSVQGTKLRKDLKYPLLTKANLTSSITSGAVGISLAFYGAGIWSLVFQTLVMSIVYNIILWSTSEWRPSLTFSWKALKQLWGFGFRMFLSGLLEAIFSRLDYLIIGKLFSPATLGFFQRAKSLDLMIITYASSSLMSILFPVLSKIKNDLPRFQTVILKSLGVISFITFLLSGGLYVTADELITMLFGSKWETSIYYFKILALSGFAYPISALLVNVLSSRGNSKAFLRLEIYKKIIFGLNLSIGFIWGIEGYLYGLVIASIIAVYLNIYFASQEIHLPFSDFTYPIISQTLISILSVIITIYATMMIQIQIPFMFILQSTLFTISYIFLSYLLKTNPYHHTMIQIRPYLLRFRSRP